MHRIYLLTLLVTAITFGQEGNLKKKKKRLPSSSESQFTTEEIATIELQWMDLLHQQLGVSPDIEDEELDLIDKQPLNKEVSSEIIKNHLEELNSKTPIEIVYNKSIESVIRNMLINRESFLKKMKRLSRYYDPIFEEKLDAYDIPQELKYLAMIESGLNPRARSRVGATGLWQFMYPTAKMYKLQIDSYIDERRDPIKSTEIACQYLSKLHKMYDNWALALAAYNSGPGNVSKAIRRSGGSKDFWQLRRYLPRETRGYYPVFVATMYVLYYSDYYNLKDDNREYHYQQTDSVMINHTITFKQISELLYVPIEKVKFLNPMYRMNVIPATKKKKYPLRLPIEKIREFLATEQEIYEIVEKENIPLPKPIAKRPMLRQGNIYIVRYGDSLWTIARKFPGVSVNNLMQWNDHLHSTKIKPGMRIKICKKC